MKRYRSILVWSAVLVLCFVFIDTAESKSIEFSKHNLSSSSTNTIRSAVTNGTTEICVFCHTPHSAAPDAPLWNRTNPSGPYTTYASDVMSALSYSLEDPSSTSAAGKAEHVKTRICMSCHDGTIAMGNVVNLPSDFPAAEISMVGAAGGLMPQSAAGYVGTDLRDDHPVAVKHLPSQDPELKTISGSNARVYGISGGRVTASQTDGGYVECTSCHDPHDDQYGNFLIDDNVNSKICRSCHSKVGIDQGAGSGADQNVHTNISAGSNAYSPPTGGTPGTLGSTVQEVKCMICHFPHKSGVESATPTSPSPGTGKYLLAYNGEQTCFNATNRWGQSSTSVCHSNASKNIQALVQLTNAHRVSNYTAPGTPHNATEGRVLSGGGTGWLGVAGNSWHVECDDRHNSHTAGRLLHAEGTNTIVSTSALYGTGGVEPSGTGAWTVLADSAYTYIEPSGAVGTGTGVTKEYQICLKCHSSFAWGTSGPISVGTPNLTDQAKEYNPANASYHSVMSAASNTWGTYLAPWTSGSQLMYCSDCHGNSTVAPAPQGPHGSAFAKILVLPYSGSTYGAAGGGAAGAQPAGELCFKCHDPNVYNNPTAGTTTTTGFSASGLNLHNQHRYREDGNTTTPNPIAYRCVNCHVRVAHGWQRKALVVMSGDGAGEPWPGAYEAGGQNTAPISAGSLLPASGAYGAAKGANCITVNGCHQ